MLDRYENQTSESILQFSLEYYIDESSFKLYKTIMTKTYSTYLMIDKENNIILNGEVMTVDSFISTFLRNHKAIQVFKDLDTRISVTYS